MPSSVLAAPLASQSAGNGQDKHQTLNTSGKSICPAIDVPSDIHLFLRNLRFLDLDLLPDWPGLTAQTFRPGKNAIVTQKDRVRCAEWVLYRLFELWNPRETKVKLKPFFPALEPRQSTQLRATLFQFLTDLKNNGVLPRDCALRKSMLDDCRGERLEELLFLFSTAVLRKVVSEESKYPTIPARLEFSEALLIAYHSSIRSNLNKKREDKARYDNLSQKLHERQREFEEHESASNRKGEEYNDMLAASNVDKETMKKHIRESCTGDESWLSLIISGDPSVDRDGLAEHSFEEMWAQTRRDEELTLLEIPKGELADFEDRVQEQKSRLDAWRVFQNDVSKRNEDLIVLQSPQRTPYKSPQKSSQRTAHKSPSKSAHRTPNNTSPAKKKYDSSMNITSKSSSLGVHRRGPSAYQIPANETSQRLFEITGSHTNKSDARGGRPLDTSEKHPSPPTNEPKSNLQSTMASDSESNSAKIDQAVAGQLERNRRETNPEIDQVNVGLNMEHDSTIALPLESQSQQGSAQQITSTSYEVPSPQTPRNITTLADRTRETLALLQPSGAKSPKGNPVTASDGAQRPWAESTSEEPPSDPLQTSGGLTERTRNSLSNSRTPASSPSNPSHPRAHKKSHSVQSPRRPVYPINPFDSPSRSPERPASSRNQDTTKFSEEAGGEIAQRPRTPEVDLFAEDAECASVFKSRPKIRTSPPEGSPIIQGYDD